MIFVGVSSRLPPPIWKSENEQGWQVSHCASEAAIFIGWYLSSTTPSSLPMIMPRKAAGSRTTSANRADRAKTSVSEPRRRCQAETASMTTEPVTSAASSTWAYAHRNTGLTRTAQMLLSSALPLLSW
jgi:hypothetical protein